jgi:hypothetical protein
MKANNTGLLLPLGIGAALLLLMARKSQAVGKQVEDDLPALPQMVPEPAPAYSPPVNARKAGQEWDSTGEEEAQEEEEPQESSAAEDEQYTEYSSTPGAKQAHAYPPVRPAVVTPYVPSRPTVVTPGSPVARQRGFAPLVIGNGKPRMGVQQAIPVQPAVAAAQQAIVIKPDTATKAKVTPVPAIKTAAPAIFPLKYGQRNDYIKELQKNIGVPATGYFGSQTRAMLQKRFKASVVSEALYRQLTMGKAFATAVKRPAAKTARNRRPLYRKAAGGKL